MCVYSVGPIETATTEMRAFKIVFCEEDGSFVSQFPPSQRIPQYRLSKIGHKIPDCDLGVEVTYRLGETVRSEFDTTPGLYTFAERDSALLHANAYERVLEVIIPTGTRYRTATSEDGMDAVLLVEELLPIHT